MPGSIRDVRVGSRLLAEGTVLQAEPEPRSRSDLGSFFPFWPAQSVKVQVNFKM